MNQQNVQMRNIQADTAMRENIAKPETNSTQNTLSE